MMEVELKSVELWRDRKRLRWEKKEKRKEK